jgi:molecular chaperone Hsp33
MLQRLPGKSEDADGWNRLQHLAASISDSELQFGQTEDLLCKLFPAENVRLFKPSQVRFGCSCSSQKVSGVLQSLGQDDIMALIEERGVVEVRCEYCGQNYQFDRVDLAALFSQSPMALPRSSGSH